MEFNSTWAWVGRRRGRPVLRARYIVLAGYLAYVVEKRYYLGGPVWLFPVGLLIMLLLSGGLVYGAYWFAGSAFDADDGPGIPAERLERAFEPGEHADRGLGLYLARTLVGDLDGEVTLADNEPRGTRVTIELPLAS